MLQQAKDVKSSNAFFLVYFLGTKPVAPSSLLYLSSLFILT
jgi:hypothetical protein